MKKIIILVDVYLPFVGGGQIWVKEISEHLLNKKDISIEIVTRKLKWNGIVANRSENFHEGRLKVTRLGFVSAWNNIFSRLLFIIQSFFYLLFADFDLIDAQVFVSGIPGKMASMIKRKPVILTVHGTNLDSDRAGILEKIILTKIKYDEIITVGASFLKYPNINKKIVVVRPGVDTNFFRPKIEKRQKNRIMFAGRLVREKGVDLLLRIIKHFESTDLKFVIIGSGEEKLAIDNFQKSSKITNLKVLPAQDKNQLLEEYQKSEILLLPSRFEGFPLTVLEAEACGLCVVACDVGDVKFLVRNNENGFICNRDDLNCLIDGIKQLTGNPELKEAVSKKNVLNMSNFTWEKSAEAICMEYKRLLK
jgi:glycosyltransferase involved in cell wall biosynthesis